MKYSLKQIKQELEAQARGDRLYIADEELFYIVKSLKHYVPGSENRSPFNSITAEDIYKHQDSV